MIKNFKSKSPRSTKPRSTKPRSTSPRSTKPRSTSPLSKSQSSTSPRSTSSRSKSQISKSPKTQSPILQNSDIFSSLRLKFTDDIYDNIEKHLDWDWAQEFETIVENEKCVLGDPKYKWDGKELTKIINTLIDKKETTEKIYNRILCRIVDTIFDLNKTPDECETKKLNHQLYIFAECASKRPYNQNTLKYIVGRFENLLEVHLLWRKSNINQFIHIESNLIKPPFYKSRTSMYLLLQFYMYYFNKMFFYYDRRFSEVVTALNLNTGPAKKIIIYLLKKINCITAYFTNINNFKKIKDKNIKEFKELYFKEVSNEHPYLTNLQTKRKIFLGNEITRDLMILIDEMIVARESRRRRLLGEKRKRNLPLTKNEELSKQIPSFTRQEKEAMSYVLSFYTSDTKPPKTICDLRKI